MPQDHDFLDNEPASMSSNELHAWFDNLSQRIKQEAYRRARILDHVSKGVVTGHTVEFSMGLAASKFGVDRGTLKAWWARIDGHRRGDWMPLLAPRSQQQARGPGGTRSGVPPVVGLRAALNELKVTAEDFRDKLDLLPDGHPIRADLMPALEAHIAAIEALR